MLDQVAGFRERGAMPQAMIRPLTTQTDFRSPFLFFAELAPFKSPGRKPEDQDRIVPRPELAGRSEHLLENTKTNVGTAWTRARVQRVTSERPAAARQICKRSPRNAGPIR